MECKNCGHEIEVGGKGMTHYYKHKKEIDGEDTCAEYVEGGYMCGCIKPEPKDKDA